MTSSDHIPSLMRHLSAKASWRFYAVQKNNTLFFKYLHHQVTNCIQCTTVCYFDKIVGKSNKALGLLMILKADRVVSKIGLNLVLVTNKECLTSAGESLQTLPTCRLINYKWLKLFASPIVRLGNSRVLRPMIRGPPGQAACPAWWEDIVSIAAFLVSYNTK